MILRLMIVGICMPIYCQQVSTKRVIRNTQIANQVLGFSDGMVRSWAESARNAQTYIEQHPNHQFAREFHTLQVLSILQQLEWLGACAVTDHNNRELEIQCNHHEKLQQEVEQLLNTSSFILDADAPDQRPENRLARDRYDMDEAGGTTWHVLKDNKVMPTGGVQNGEPDEELTKLWLYHTQTQEMAPSQDQS